MTAAPNNDKKLFSLLFVARREGRAPEEFLIAAAKASDIDVPAFASQIDTDDYDDSKWRICDIFAGISVGTI